MPQEALPPNSVIQQAQLGMWEVLADFAQKIHEQSPLVGSPKTISPSAIESQRQSM